MVALVLSCAAALRCNATDHDAATKRSTESTMAVESAPTDLIAANLDPATRPAQDFFQYANGGWLARNPIPASESAWTIGHLVNEELYRIKREIAEKAAAQLAAPRGSDAQKIGDFWAAAIEPATAEAIGIAPLQPWLDRIAAVATPADAIGVATELQEIGVEAFWSFGVGQDQKQSDVMAVMLSQGGLGLPERDYYFNAEEGVAKARTEYPKHLARLFMLLGQGAQAAASAGDAVLVFETALAQASKPLEALRDPHANYHKMSVATFHEYAPHVEWRALLDHHGLATADALIVGQPEFFVVLDALLQSTPVETLRAYLTAQLLHEYAAYLPTAFDLEHFAFFGRELQGAKEQRPRWKRVLDAQESAMGMVVGRLFVQDYFPAPTKQRYVDMVEAIRTTYREHIESLDWMSATTKEKALAKLATMKNKVGFPDRWKDMSALEVARDSFCANMVRAARFDFADSIQKFGKPVDRDEWEMTPQTYNAYYNASNNEIVLPAGIFLIPGLKDADADDAVVYGYAGASTIGHEITHGFDDEGRQFDAAGNLVDWWTAEDEAQFKRRAAVMVAQFDAYEPLPGLHINGEATLGENIADFGGVVLGLDAFKKTAQYREGKPIAGLTPTQRYFLGYALGWLGHPREARLRQALLSDVHSPAKWRVIGPMVNVPEFMQAFDVKPGDPMWRDEAARVRIW
ncbi:MAG: M13 family peptidase [Planctomycetes bacterium]|nr:M13 family peptidase [Planctomycetota bacterium]